MRILCYIILLAVWNVSCTSVESTEEYLENEVLLLNQVFPILVDTNLYPVEPPEPSTENGKIEAEELEEKLQRYRAVKNACIYARIHGYPFYVVDTLMVPPMELFDNKLQTDSEFSAYIQTFKDGYIKLSQLKTEKLLNLNKLTNTGYYQVSKPGMHKEQLIGWGTGMVRFSRVGFNKNFTKAMVFYEFTHATSDEYGVVAFFIKNGERWALEHRQLIVR